METTIETGTDYRDGPEDVPEVSYCTPEEVAEALDLPDQHDRYATFMFSDVSHPSVKQVCRMIRANEDVIDRRMRRSWRENRVKDYLCDISFYRADANARRYTYYLYGGEYIQLRHDVLPWDPTPVEEGGKGDKLEIRKHNNVWTDVSHWIDSASHGTTLAWMDYPMGKLYIRTPLYQAHEDAVRITYRYGYAGEPPYAIRRLCALMTASQVLNMQAFNIKLGTGGDISGIREGIQQAWEAEMAGIWASYQRSGSLHSMLR